MRRILVVSFIIATILITVGLLVVRPQLPADAAPGSAYAKSGDGKEAKVSVGLTFYAFTDNSGQTESQHGSADIAHPVIHKVATEGTGTYKDPITFASRDDDRKTFPVGSLIYVPLTHKYYIMEDQCGDTDPQGCLHGPGSAKHHVDLWMGPDKPANTNSCADDNTPDNFVNVLINPTSDHPVNTTPEFSNGKCTLKTF